MNGGTYTTVVAPSRQRDDAELAGHVRKAVDGNAESAAKPKHLGHILSYASMYQTTAPMWQTLQHLQAALNAESVSAYKALTLVHRVLIMGPSPIALQEAWSERRLLRDLTEQHGSGSSQPAGGYGPLIARLGAYLLQKLQFHRDDAPQVPPDYGYSDYDAVQCLHRTSQSSAQVHIIKRFLRQLAIIVDLLGSTLRLGNGSECKLAPVICLVPESHGLYQYVTSLLTLLHMCSDAPPVQLIDDYERCHRGLREVYEQVTLVPLLRMIVDVPRLPRRAVTFECFAPESTRIVTLDAPIATSSLDASLHAASRGPHDYVTQQDSETAEMIMMVREENEELQGRLATFHRQALTWKQQVEHKQQTERRDWEQRLAQSQEQARQLQSMLKDIGGRYAQALRDQDTLVERLSQLSLRVKDLRSRDQHQSQNRGLQDPFGGVDEKASDQGASSSLSQADWENVLDGTLRIVEDIAGRMAEQSPGKQETRLAQAVRELVRRAIIVQAIVVRGSGEPNAAAFYRRHSVWTAGFRSAACDLADYTVLLEQSTIDHPHSSNLHYDQVDNALESGNVSNDGVEGNDQPELERIKARAAARQLNAGTIQLVTAARVKYPQFRGVEGEERDDAPLEALLQAAATVSHLSKLISSEEEEERASDDFDGQEADTTDLQRKVQEMNLHADVLGKERQLQEARERLVKLRQAAYSTCNDQSIIHDQ